MTLVRNSWSSEFPLLHCQHSDTVIKKILLNGHPQPCITIIEFFQRVEASFFKLCHAQQISSEYLLFRWIYGCVIVCVHLHWYHSCLLFPKMISPIKICSCVWKESCQCLFYIAYTQYIFSSENVAICRLIFFTPKFTVGLKPLPTKVQSYLATHSRCLLAGVSQHFIATPYFWQAVLHPIIERLLLLCLSNGPLPHLMGSYLLWLPVQR